MYRMRMCSVENLSLPEHAVFRNRLFFSLSIQRSIWYFVQKLLRPHFITIAIEQASERTRLAFGFGRVGTEGRELGGHIWYEEKKLSFPC